MNNIVEVKIAPSDEILQDSDFETKGDRLPILEGTNVTASYEVNKEGKYKIYIKDSKGHIVIQETSYLPLQSEKTMDVKHKKDDINALVINVNDSMHNIILLKVIGVQEEPSMDQINNNSTELTITPGKNVTTEYTVSNDSVYVGIYVKDEYGFEHTWMLTKNSIEEEKGAIVVPIEPEEPIQKEPESEEPKTQEPVQEEQQSQSNPVQEEPKQEENQSQTENTNNSENSQNENKEGLVVPIDNTQTDNSQINNTTQNSEQLPDIKTIEEMLNGNSSDNNNTNITEQQTNNSVENNQNQENSVKTNLNNIENNESKPKNITISTNEIVNNENENNNISGNTEVTTNSTTSEPIKIVTTNQETNLQNTENQASTRVNVEKMPETGVNDIGLIVSIIAFIAIAIYTFIEYKRIK